MPLRALKVNTAAFELLQRCSDGLTLDNQSVESPVPVESALSLFDRLCRAGLLEWKPPEDGFEPFVSIVVAVYNRAGEIGSCLESLLNLDYPRSKYEIIVVDDASDDDTPSVVSQFDVKLLRQNRNGGQSAARNAGVAQANGEIVAFIDSDCTAEPEWLRELVPYFQDSRNALAGGYVDSYYRESVLDRFEATKSPLNMGQDLVVGSGEESDFYVPTCNMLVRREVYLTAGGLDEELRVGEDVDFCWKLKENGHRLIYVPKGRIRHKHRNRFVDTFKRRFDYGTSEPVLYSRHRAIFKHYPWQPSCMTVFFLCGLGLLGWFTWFAPAAGLIFLWDMTSKKRFYQEQVGIGLTFSSMLKVTASRYFELLYHLCSHLVRYYFVLMIPFAFLFPTIIPIVAALVLIPSIAEFFRKKPLLGFPVFLVLYLAEQMSYQAGVFWGCIKQRGFRTYRLVFATPGSEPRTSFFHKIKAIFGYAGNSAAVSR
ncbi:MAG: mycofactocin biosynthesis glycosyltransferase MftF [Desulfomonile tiedjei]|uniref:Mycofactocin biosynthesis glycosyltransferase MftF n=1 Tax=Desulfomonile tiedjei TaxID=2358 RepID=A0A9D6YZ51_9BACT|nr:mycofactocin biosynthesis glycosyltransferase MftF [Desulfomonile tiedjei]